MDIAPSNYIALHSTKGGTFEDVTSRIHCSLVQGLFLLQFFFFVPRRGRSWGEKFWTWLILIASGLAEHHCLCVLLSQLILHLTSGAENCHQKFLSSFAHSSIFSLCIYILYTLSIGILSFYKSLKRTREEKLLSPWTARRKPHPVPSPHFRIPPPADIDAHDMRIHATPPCLLPKHGR